MLAKLTALEVGDRTFGCLMAEGAVMTVITVGIDESMLSARLRLPLLLDLDLPPPWGRDATSIRFRTTSAHMTETMATTENTPMMIMVVNGIGPSNPPFSISLPADASCALAWPTVLMSDLSIRSLSGDAV